jgi:hypothetical protein
MIHKEHENEKEMLELISELAFYPPEQDELGICLYCSNSNVRYIDWHSKDCVWLKAHKLLVRYGYRIETDEMIDDKKYWEAQNGK